MAHRSAILFAVAFPALTFAGAALAQQPNAAAPAGGAAPPATQGDAPGAPFPRIDGVASAATDKRALAEMLFYSARGLMYDNQIAKACQRFGESYRLDPTPGTLLNLAVCHEKEGKLASAWGEFHQALTEAQRSNRPEREQLAKDSIARIEPDLAYLTIIVPKTVRVARLGVQRNGVPLEEGGWEIELPIDPGTNEITATAPQYRPEKKLVTIQKREHLTVTIDPLVLAPVVRPPPPYWTSSRVLGVSTMAAGVLATGAGAVFGVLTLNDKAKSLAHCHTFDQQPRCDSTAVDAMSRANTEAIVADVGIGVGVAAIVTGGVLMLTGGAHEQSGPAPAGVPPSDHGPPQAAWRFDFIGGPRAAEGLLTRSF